MSYNENEELGFGPYNGGMIPMFNAMIETLKANPRKIVFTEGHDARILEATSRLVEGGFLTPILIGNVEEVKANAAKGGIGSVVPEPLTALCSFTLSEDSMGTSSADFRKNKAGLPRDFITHRYSPFRCFRPVFSKVLPKSRIFSFDP